MIWWDKLRAKPVFRLYYTRALYSSPTDWRTVGQLLQFANPGAFVVHTPTDTLVARK